MKEEKEMKKIIKEFSKSEVVIKLPFFKYKKTKFRTTETSDIKARKKKNIKLIRSLAWKIFEFIIKQMIAAIISAKMNGLFYKFLIRIRMSFFIRTVRYGY